MSGNEYPVYDFRKAAANDDSAMALRQWLGNCSQQMSDHWNRLAGFDLTMELSDITTVTYKQCLEGFTNKCGGFFLIEFFSCKIW